MIEQAKMFRRFVTGLRGFLKAPLSPDDCRRIIEESLRNREETFLLLVRRAIYGYPRSPYLALLKWAGVEYGDLERMVKQDGVEPSLERLFDAGVHIDLEEFKGRLPIQRPGLTLKVSPQDFDNPLLAREFEVESGGSTGARRRMSIDFDLLVHDAACRFASFQAQGVEDRALAVWRGVPPDSSGLKHGLIAAKTGMPMERWFSPVPVSWKPQTFAFAVLTTSAVLGGRLWGRIPPPEYVPLSDGRPVARWLADKVRAGTPGLLSVAASNAVRACIAARDEELDISGTMFRVSGEPFTEAKYRVISEMGGKTCSGWSMSEAGPLAGGCADREALDDVHLFSGKIAIFQRPKLLTDGESTVDALYLTTILTSTPKIMLNLNSGDYGVLSKRRCGCLLGEMGFDYHLHTIRNYEKLTAGGIQFVGTDIIRLVEEVLPSSFGGDPTDYQFVEEETEDGAMSQVSIVVSPQVGEVDEGEVVNAVLQHLSAQSDGNRLMARFWEGGRTLRVIRRAPYVTPASKTPPLRVLRK